VGEDPIVLFCQKHILGSMTRLFRRTNHADAIHPLSEPMKVLVQNPLTLSYFQNDDKWTNDPDTALDFKESRNAARYCSDHGLLDMEIVLKFPQERYDVHLPAWTADSRSSKDFAPAAATTESSHFAV